MPRLNTPIRGGAHPQGRHGQPLRDGDGECTGCREKAQEIESLRKEISRSGADGAAAGGRLLGASAMMWMALCVCGAGLLFALAAILRHG
jgi:hypothetical protein